MRIFSPLFTLYRKVNFTLSFLIFRKGWRCYVDYRQKI